MPGQKKIKKKRSSAKSRASNQLKTLPENQKRDDDLIPSIPEQIQQHIHEQNIIQANITNTHFENFKYRRTQQAKLHQKLLEEKIQLKTQTFMKIVNDIIDMSVYVINGSNASFECLKHLFTWDNLNISSEFPEYGQEVTDQILAQILPRPYEPFIWHVDQLLVLSTDMLKIAPSGYCSIKSFAYYLQDILYCTRMDKKIIRAPLRWREMSPDSVANFVLETANGKESVNWRAVVINLSGLRKPTLDELLQQQRIFIEKTVLDGQTLITRRSFNRCELWFERDFEEETRDPGMLYWRKFWYRSLLFKIYRVNLSSINFMALLLDLAMTNDRWESFIRIMSLINHKKFIREQYLGVKYELHLNRRCQAFRNFTEDLTDSLLRSIFSKETKLSEKASSLTLESQQLKRSTDTRSCFEMFTLIKSDEIEMDQHYLTKGEYFITFNELKRFLRSTCGKGNYESGVRICSKIFCDVVRKQVPKNSVPKGKGAFVHRLYENESFQDFLKVHRHGLQTKNYLKIAYEILNQ